MRCIECEEIELARVRDQRAGADARRSRTPALDGFPAGRTPSRPDPPAAAAVGRRRASRRSTRPRSSAGSRSGSRSPRPPTRPSRSALVLLYLAGGNDGLNIDPAQRRRATTAALRSTRGRSSTAARAPTPAARVGSLAAARPGRRAALAFANVDGLAGGGDNNGDARLRLRHALRRRHRRPGLRPRGDARGRRQEVHASATSTTRDIWFEASADLNNKTGWLGPLDRPQRRRDNPLQAISIDTALSKSIRTATNPVCAITSLPMAGFTLNSAATPPAANGTTDSTRTISTLARRRRRRGQRLPRRARARPTGSPYSDATTTVKRATAPPPAYTPTYPNTGTLSHAPADGRAPARGQPRHADHHDPLGRLRHPHQPAHEPGQAAQGALARARRLPGRPEGPRDRPPRVARWCSPSSAAA